jgi:hypothetical protein
MLTRDFWDADGLRLFDACWREAILSDLFGDAFEADRHRIQQCVDGARQRLTARESKAILG